MLINNIGDADGSAESNVNARNADVSTVGGGGRRPPPKSLALSSKKKAPTKRASSSEQIIHGPASTVVDGLTIPGEASNTVTHTTQSPSAMEIAFGSYNDVNLRTQKRAAPTNGMLLHHMSRGRAHRLN